MALYTEFWKKTFKELLGKINPAQSINFQMPIPELAEFGKREESSYNGKLIVWVGKTEYNKDSAVFRNFKTVVDEHSQLVNKIPGELLLTVTNNDTLEVNYQPINFELLVKRYQRLSIDIKQGEVYKWKLVKSFQDRWVEYAQRKTSFTDFFTKTDFRNLIYHDAFAVIKHMVRERPADFEKLLLRLYDENIPLKERIDFYLTDTEQLYFDLPGHGKNLFQDERTIATLLAFRFPEKYTFFKDSFYSVLSKGLGFKPAPRKEKLLHYYSIVNDFLKTCLPKHQEVIDTKNELLDDTCYQDINNQLLAQDIFYKTIESNGTKTDDSTNEEDSPIFNSENKKAHIMSPLNSILYGPPGTGKTYHTINKAVAIANPLFNIETSSRAELKTEYERLVKEGQIEFVTFHQSMTYEDFIEGIKPVEPKEGDPFLKYEIKEGIFKRLAERASKVPDAKPTGFSISEEDFQKAGFYKLSLGDTSNPDDDLIYDWCIKNGYIALGWGDAIDFTFKKESDIQQMVPSSMEKFAAQAVNYFIHYIKQGDYVVVTYGNLQFRAIGQVTGDYEYKNVDGLHVHQFRKVEWLVTNLELPYEELYNKQFSQQSIYRLDKREIKKDFFVKNSGVLDSGYIPKNYVLIIDEINRGNVSQIFGDLITLIEDDKRMGKNEALTVTLPYSKKNFSVPPNLYIIGTMNTADRSVEALDTALRRRFVFEEMSPDVSKITENPLDIDLQKMLTVINARLEALLSKDQTIGHAWLMKINSLSTLQIVFKNKILPLLQEFFYNDYAKIGLVLGNAFVAQRKVSKKTFASFADENELAGDYEGKVIYTLNDPVNLTQEDFHSIYL